MTTKALTPVQKVPLDVKGLEELAGRYDLTLIGVKGRFEQALYLAEGVEQLRAVIMPHIGRFMPLMGTALGFLTDRDSKPDKYPAEVVCDVLIEATLRGFRPINNEFNIISGRFYGAKNGYKRQVRDFPGLTNLALNAGVPKMFNGGAIVPYEATWSLDGKKQTMRCEIPVRMNSGSGADQILGKAERKILARIHARLTGSEHSAEDGADDLPVAGVLTSGDRRDPEAHKRINELLGLLEMPEGTLEAWARDKGIALANPTADQEQEILAWLEGLAEAQSIGAEGEGA